MSATDYEERIAQEPDLRQLLQDKEISSLSSFPPLKYQDKDFLAYIQPQLLDSFHTIYDQYIDTEKQGKITALLRAADVLGTDETKASLEPKVIQTVKAAAEKLDTFRDKLLSGSSLEAEAKKLDEVYEYSVLHILNGFGHLPEIATLKDRIVRTSLGMCDTLKDVNPKKQMMHYAVYNVVMNNLKELKSLGNHREHYESHLTKIEKKRSGIEVKYVLGIVFFVLFFIIRIIIRMNR